MTNPNDILWYSGDWKPINNPEIPYNGIKIEATPEYTPKTNQSTKQELVSVEVNVTDFTKVPKGVSSTITLDKIRTWYDIPIPDPNPNKDFTVTGIYLDGNPGKLELFKTNTDDVYLRIQFRYGLEHMSREELGFILKFDAFVEE